MNEQLDLLTSVPLLSRAPIARCRGPDTSRTAAAAITESGARGRQQCEVLDLVARYPLHTSRELAATNWNGCHYHLDRWKVASRLRELTLAGLVECGDGHRKRCCQVSGLKALTWALTLKGEQEWHALTTR